MQVLTVVRSTAGCESVPSALGTVYAFAMIFNRRLKYPVPRTDDTNKKAVNETPVREPKFCGLRLPQRGRDFINGSIRCGFHT